MSFGNDLLAFAGAPDEGDSFVRAVPLPEIPAMDGKLFVRKISAAELDAITLNEDEGNFRSRSAVLFASDAAGHRIWGDHQADALGKNKRLLFLVERINHHGRQHNGLTVESRELVAKNSEPEVANGSPASSAEPRTADADSTGDA
jgi:hypothetical protein